jgi:hypothetical protein
VTLNTNQETIIDDDFGMLPVANNYQSLKNLHSYQEEVRSISIGADSRNGAAFRVQLTDQPTKKPSKQEHENLASLQLRTKKVLDMY